MIQAEKLAEVVDCGNTIGWPATFIIVTMIICCTIIIYALIEAY